MLIIVIPLLASLARCNVVNHIFSTGEASTCNAFSTIISEHSQNIGAFAKMVSNHDQQATMAEKNQKYWK